MANIIPQIVDMTLGSVNVGLVIILIAVGAILKHACKSLNNNMIPVILIPLSVVIVIGLNTPFDLKEMLIPLLVEGIASAYCAIIVHEKSKDIYNNIVEMDKSEQEKAEAEHPEDE